MDNRRGSYAGKDVGYAKADSVKAFQRDADAGLPSPLYSGGLTPPDSKLTRLQRPTHSSLLRSSTDKPLVPKSVSARHSGRYNNVLSQSVDFRAEHRQAGGASMIGAGHHTPQPTMQTRPSIGGASPLPLPPTGFSSPAPGTVKPPELRSLLEAAQDKEHLLQELKTSKDALQRQYLAQESELRQSKAAYSAMHTQCELLCRQLDHASAELNEIKACGSVAATTSEVCTAALSQTMLSTMTAQATVGAQEAMLGELVSRVNAQQQELAAQQRQLQVKGQEVEQIMEELYKTEQQVSKLTARLARAAKLEERVVELETDLEGRGIEVEYLHSRIAEYKTEMVKLQELVAEQERDNLALAGQNENLQTEVAALCRDNTQLAGEATGLRDQCSDLQERECLEVEVLRGEYQALRQGFAVLEAERDNLQGEKEELQDQLEDALLTAATGTASVERDMHSSAAAARAQMAAIMLQLGEAQVAHAGAEAQLQDKQAEVAKAHAQLAAVQQQLQAAQAECSGLREDRGSLRNQVEVLGRGISEAQVAVQQMQAELEAKSLEVGHLRGELGLSQTTVEELRHCLENARRRTSDLQEQLNPIAANEHALLERIRAAEHERQGLLQQLDDGHQLAESFKARLREMTQLAGQVAAWRAQCEALESQLAHAGGQVAASAEQLTALQGEVQRLRQVEDLASEQARLVERREQQLQALRQELDAAQEDLQGKDAEMRLLHMQAAQNEKLRQRLAEVEALLAADKPAQGAAADVTGSELEGTDAARAQPDDAAGEAPADADSTGEQLAGERTCRGKKGKRCDAAAAVNGGVSGRRGSRVGRALLGLLVNASIMTIGALAGAAAMATPEGRKVVDHMASRLARTRRASGRRALGAAPGTAAVAETSMAAGSEAAVEVACEAAVQ